MDILGCPLAHAGRKVGRKNKSFRHWALGIEFSVQLCSCQGVLWFIISLVLFLTYFLCLWAAEASLSSVSWCFSQNLMVFIHLCTRHQHPATEPTIFTFRSRGVWLEPDSRWCGSVLPPLFKDIYKLKTGLKRHFPFQDYLLPYKTWNERKKKNKTLDIDAIAWEGLFLFLHYENLNLQPGFRNSGSRILMQPYNSIFRAKYSTLITRECMLWGRTDLESSPRSDAC